MAEPHSIDSLSDEAFGWYLAGLTDGEGCFALNFIDWHGDTVDRRTWRLSYHIALRADDGVGLKAICRRMGCGVISVNVRGNRNPNSKPLVSWVVTDVDQLSSVVVPHFERFPLALKKRRDFDIWKQAVPARVAIKHRNRGMGWGRYRKGQKLITPAEHAFFQSLSDQLKATRAYASTPESVVVPPLPDGHRPTGLFDGLSG